MKVSKSAKASWLSVYICLNQVILLQPKLPTFEEIQPEKENDRPS